MKREEAIELLDNLIGMIEDNQNNDYDEALKMGIKALENQKTLQTELEQLKAEIAQIYKIYYPDLSFNETGDCYIQRKSVADVIDKHIYELRGEQNG